MQREHQKLLERNYITLINHMPVEHVRDCMIKSELYGLNCEEVAKIDASPSKQEKARLIIESLIRRGPRAFEFFVNALSSASGNYEMAATLAREGNIPLHDQTPGGSGRSYYIDPGLTEYDGAVIFGDRPTVHAMPVQDESNRDEANLLFGHRCLTIRLLDDPPS